MTATLMTTWRPTIAHLMTENGHTLCGIQVPPGWACGGFVDVSPRQAMCGCARCRVALETLIAREDSDVQEED